MNEHIVKSCHSLCVSPEPLFNADCLVLYRTLVWLIGFLFRCSIVYIDCVFFFFLNLELDFSSLCLLQQNNFALYLSPVCYNMSKVSVYGF